MTSNDDIQSLLDEDSRFKLDAYQFVRDALQYAHQVLHMEDERYSDEKPQRDAVVQPSAQLPGERHLTGQQLSEAIRQYAVEQYGYMAKTVLNNWGIETTGHFGDIVYNMIRVGLMKKSPKDRREDFDDVYDFEKAFRQDFRIEPTEAN